MCDVTEARMLQRGDMLLTQKNSVIFLLLVERLGGWTLLRFDADTGECRIASRSEAFLRALAETRPLLRRSDWTT